MKIVGPGKLVIEGELESFDVTSEGIIFNFRGPARPSLEFQRINVQMRTTIDKLGLKGLLNATLDFNSNKISV